MKVQIVEDELIIAKVYKMFLEKEGHEIVSSVADGRRALEEFKLHQPDLVMLDIQLNSSLTGLEVAKSIRKMSDAFIIFVTASPLDHTVNMTSMIPNSEVLIKPVELSTLSDKLAELEKQD
ncbi:MAG: response regulator [Bacteroidetes bacterium]|nr:response regulator [Bacteroidota bacterium]